MFELSPDLPIPVSVAERDGYLVLVLREFTQLRELVSRCRRARPRLLRFSTSAPALWSVAGGPAPGGRIREVPGGQSGGRTKASNVAR